MFKLLTRGTYQKNSAALMVKGNVSHASIGMHITVMERCLLQRSLPVPFESKSFLSSEYSK